MRAAPTVACPANVQFAFRGQVPAGDAEYLRQRIAASALAACEPPLSVRVRLTHRNGPAVHRPALAQATVLAADRPVRVQVAAATLCEAVDLLIHRLEERLVRVAEHWEARRLGAPPQWPADWRLTALRPRQSSHIPRPALEREITRRKTFDVPRERVDEAAFEMESMDYDFRLFVDAATGQDSLVSRSGPTGYLLSQAIPRPLEGEPIAVPLTVNAVPAPRLCLAQARRLLDTACSTLVFFIDTTTGRGNVLYHRFDGHYGLVVPAKAPVARRTGAAPRRYRRSEPFRVGHGSIVLEGVGN